MKKTDVGIVEEALQYIKDIFEDIVILRSETVNDEASWDSWYQWSIDYLMENLSITEDKAKFYLEKLNIETNEDTGKNHGQKSRH